ncbi:MAG: metal ABC transporter ATP-binding protein [Candidatus Coatesbacteria bacterium]|nr:metal ABC transporter ATP-binding protein [Candidatus Coatesbacteria bacterium]
MSEAIVKLDNVFVKYSSIIALENVTLEIEEGSFCTVIGPNGSGKTTLLKCIIGITKPSSGTIKVFGIEATKLGKKRLDIGYVSQSINIDFNVPISVFDFVLMGRYSHIGMFRYPLKEDKNKVIEAMEMVEIKDLANRKLIALSGGQKQRAFLARALVNNPRLLLLDEPTTGVDTKSTDNFYMLLKSLHNNGITIILVSHDIGVVASFSKKVVCLNNYLVAHDVPEKVMNESDLQTMYGKEASFFHHHDVTPHIVVRKHDD